MPSVNSTIRRIGTETHKRASDAIANGGRDMVLARHQPLRGCNEDFG
jgi:hypothetical protein